MPRVDPELPPWAGEALRCLTALDDAGVDTVARLDAVAALRRALAGGGLSLSTAEADGLAMESVGASADLLARIKARAAAQAGTTRPGFDAAPAPRKAPLGWPVLQTTLRAKAIEAFTSVLDSQTSYAESLAGKTNKKDFNKKAAASELRMLKFKQAGAANKAGAKAGEAGYEADIQSAGRAQYAKERAAREARKVWAAGDADHEEQMERIAELGRHALSLELGAQARVVVGAHNERVAATLEGRGGAGAFEAGMARLGYDAWNAPAPEAAVTAAGIAATVGGSGGGAGGKGSSSVGATAPAAGLTLSQTLLSSTGGGRGAAPAPSPLLAAAASLTRGGSSSTSSTAAAGAAPLPASAGAAPSHSTRPRIGALPSAPVLGPVEVPSRVEGTLTRLLGGPSGGSSAAAAVASASAPLGATATSRTALLDTVMGLLNSNNNAGAEGEGLAALLGGETAAAEGDSYLGAYKKWATTVGTLYLPEEGDVYQAEAEARVQEAATGRRDRATRLRIQGAAIAAETERAAERAAWNARVEGLRKDAAANREAAAAAADAARAKAAAVAAGAAWAAAEEERRSAAMTAIMDADRVRLQAEREAAAAAAAPARAAREAHRAAAASRAREAAAALGAETAELLVDAALEALATMRANLTARDADTAAALGSTGGLVDPVFGVAPVPLATTRKADPSTGALMLVPKAVSADPSVPASAGAWVNATLAYVPPLLTPAQWARIKHGFIKGTLGAERQRKEAVAAVGAAAGVLPPPAEGGAAGGAATEPWLAAAETLVDAAAGAPAGGLEADALVERYCDEAEVVEWQLGHGVWAAGAAGVLAEAEAAASAATDGTIADLAALPELVDSLKRAAAEAHNAAALGPATRFPAPLRLLASLPDGLPCPAPALFTPLADAEAPRGWGGASALSRLLRRCRLLLLDPLDVLLAGVAVFDADVAAAQEAATAAATEAATASAAAAATAPAGAKGGAKGGKPGSASAPPVATGEPLGRLAGYGAFYTPLPAPLASAPVALSASPALAPAFAWQRAHGDVKLSAEAVAAALPPLLPPPAPDGPVAEGEEAVAAASAAQLPRPSPALVAARRDLFVLGASVWAALSASQAALAQALETAAKERERLARAAAADAQGINEAAAAAGAADGGKRVPSAGAAKGGAKPGGKGAPAAPADPYEGITVDRAAECGPQALDKVAVASLASVVAAVAAAAGVAPLAVGGGASAAAPPAAAAAAAPAEGVLTQPLVLAALAWRDSVASAFVKPKPAPPPAAAAPAPAAGAAGKKAAAPAPAKGGASVSRPGSSAPQTTPQQATPADDGLSYGHAQLEAAFAAASGAGTTLPLPLLAPLCSTLAFAAAFGGLLRVTDAAVASAAAAAAAYPWTAPAEALPAGAGGWVLSPGLPSSGATLLALEWALPPLPTAPPSSAAADADGEAAPPPASLLWVPAKPHPEAELVGIEEQPEAGLPVWAPPGGWEPSPQAPPGWEGDLPALLSAYASGRLRLPRTDAAGVAAYRAKLDAAEALKAVTGTVRPESAGSSASSFHAVTLPPPPPTASGLHGRLALPLVAREPLQLHGAAASDLATGLPLPSSAVVAEGADSSADGAYVTAPASLAPLLAAAAAEVAVAYPAPAAYGEGGAAAPAAKGKAAPAGGKPPAAAAAPAAAGPAPLPPAALGAVMAEWGTFPRLAVAVVAPAAAASDDVDDEDDAAAAPAVEAVEPPSASEAAPAPPSPAALVAEWCACLLGPEKAVTLAPSGAALLADALARPGHHSRQATSREVWTAVGALERRLALLAVAAASSADVSTTAPPLTATEQGLSLAPAMALARGWAAPLPHLSALQEEAAALGRAFLVACTPAMRVLRLAPPRWKGTLREAGRRVLALLALADGTNSGSSNGDAAFVLASDPRFLTSATLQGAWKRVARWVAAASAPLAPHTAAAGVATVKAAAAGTLASTTTSSSNSSGGAPTFEEVDAVVLAIEEGAGALWRQCDAMKRAVTALLDAIETAVAEGAEEQTQHDDEEEDESDASALPLQLARHRSLLLGATGVAAATLAAAEAKRLTDATTLLCHANHALVSEVAAYDAWLGGLTATAEAAAEGEEAVTAAAPAAFAPPPLAVAPAVTPAPPPAPAVTDEEEGEDHNSAAAAATAPLQELLALASGEVAGLALVPVASSNSSSEEDCADATLAPPAWVAALSSVTLPRWKAASSRRLASLAAVASAAARWTDAALAETVGTCRRLAAQWLAGRDVALRQTAQGLQELLLGLPVPGPGGYPVRPSITQAAASQAATLTFPGSPVAATLASTVTGRYMLGGGGNSEGEDDEDDDERGGAAASQRRGAGGGGGTRRLPGTLFPGAAASASSALWHGAAPVDTRSFPDEAPTVPPKPLLVSRGRRLLREALKETLGPLGPADFALPLRDGLPHVFGSLALRGCVSLALPAGAPDARLMLACQSEGGRLASLGGCAALLRRHVLPHLAPRPASSTSSATATRGGPGPQPLPHTFASVLRSQEAGGLAVDPDLPPVWAAHSLDGRAIAVLTTLLMEGVDAGAHVPDAWKHPHGHGHGSTSGGRSGHHSSAASSTVPSRSGQRSPRHHGGASERASGSTSARGAFASSSSSSGADPDEITSGLAHAVSFLTSALANTAAMLANTRSDEGGDDDGEGPSFPWAHLPTAAAKALCRLYALSSGPAPLALNAGATAPEPRYCWDVLAVRRFIRAVIATRLRAPPTPEQLLWFRRRVTAVSSAGVATRRDLGTTLFWFETPAATAAKCLWEALSTPRLIVPGGSGGGATRSASPSRSGSAATLRGAASGARHRRPQQQPASAGLSAKSGGGAELLAAVAAASRSHASKLESHRIDPATGVLLATSVEAQGGWPDRDAALEQAFIARTPAERAADVGGVREALMRLYTLPDSGGDSIDTTSLVLDCCADPRGGVRLADRGALAHGVWGWRSHAPHASAAGGSSSPSGSRRASVEADGSPSSSSPRGGGGLHGGASGTATPRRGSLTLLSSAPLLLGGATGSDEAPARLPLPEALQWSAGGDTCVGSLPNPQAPAAAVGSSGSSSGTRSSQVSPRLPREALLAPACAAAPAALLACRYPGLLKALLVVADVELEAAVTAGAFPAHEQANWLRAAMLRPADALSVSRSGLRRVLAGAGFLTVGEGGPAWALPPAAAARAAAAASASPIEALRYTRKPAALSLALEATVAAVPPAPGGQKLAAAAAAAAGGECSGDDDEASGAVAPYVLCVPGCVPPSVFASPDPSAAAAAARLQLPVATLPVAGGFGAGVDPLQLLGGMVAVPWG